VKRRVRQEDEEEGEAGDLLLPSSRLFVSFTF